MPSGGWKMLPTTFYGNHFNNHWSRANSLLVLGRLYLSTCFFRSKFHQLFQPWKFGQTSHQKVCIEPPKNGDWPWKYKVLTCLNLGKRRCFEENWELSSWVSRSIFLRAFVFSGWEGGITHSPKPKQRVSPWKVGVGFLNGTFQHTLPETNSKRSWKWDGTGRWWSFPIGFL